MKQPCPFEINPEQVAAVVIEHVLFKVGTAGKDEMLLRLLKLYNPYLAIVFVKKKEQVEGVVTKLHQAGYAVEGLQGDLEQAKRKQVMRRFREAKTQILVATDLASRGLDVEGITHVINYDLPINSDQYVHRTGRTGRAAETGLAVNLIKTEDEEHKLKQIAQKLGQTFVVQAIVNDEIITKPASAKKQPVASDKKAKPAAKRAKTIDKSSKYTDKRAKAPEPRTKTTAKNTKSPDKKTRGSEKATSYPDKGSRATDKTTSYPDQRTSSTDKSKPAAKRNRPTDKKEFPGAKGKSGAKPTTRPTTKPAWPAGKQAKPAERKANPSAKRGK